MKSTTPRILGEAMLRGLPEQAPGIMINQSGEGIAKVVSNSGLKLMVVDDADQLNKEHFEALHDLSRKTGCSVVLIGTSETRGNQ